MAAYSRRFAPAGKVALPHVKARGGLVMCGSPCPLGDRLHRRLHRSSRRQCDVNGWRGRCQCPPVGIGRKYGLRALATRR